MRRRRKLLVRWFVAAGVIGAVLWGLWAALTPPGRPASEPPPPSAVRVPSIEPVRFHRIQRTSYSIYRMGQ